MQITTGCKAHKVISLIILSNLEDDFIIHTYRHLYSAADKKPALLSVLGAALNLLRVLGRISFVNVQQFVSEWNTIRDGTLWIIK